jgi:Cu-processing system ATP-binding protein
MITVRKLTKSFRSQEVLRGLDLDVAPMRVTALLGPNGSGKTTLLKTILGLTRADTGELLVDSRRIDRDGAYRARIGSMPQIARFPENLTAAELLAMLRDLRGFSRAETDETLIERFTLAPDMDKPLRTLSGGTRQKVNAVIAFLFHPRLLILDEPTAGLDPVANGVLKDAIMAARDDGRTVLISSHVMSELEEITDDVVFLLDGRTRFQGPVRELKRSTRQFTMERAIAEMMREGRAA